jgi:hypothetical protein
MLGETQDSMHGAAGTFAAVGEREIALGRAFRRGSRGMAHISGMKLSLLAAPFALAACAATPPPDGIARAGMNERVYVDGPYVTPLAVLEDSRCPINVRCVWAGRVRLSVRIDLGSRSETREIASDAPIQVADGQLALVEVRPERVAGDRPDTPKPYRFGFAFAGGL